MSMNRVKLAASWREAVSKVADPLQATWEGLSEKDQRALSLLTLFGLPVLLIWGLWMPSLHARSEAESERIDAMSLLTLIRNEAPALRGVSGIKMTLADLPQQLQAQAQADGLSVTRIETDATGVRMTLTNTRLTSVTTFLQNCRNKGIRVVDAQFSRDGATNQVKILLNV